MSLRQFEAANLNIASEDRLGRGFITTAVVTNVDDKDGKEKLAKIKVKYLTSCLKGYETEFIRVMTPMSGEGWGMCFWPEVGQEVLVAFLDGDISRPYVIGSLYNAKNKPPFVPEKGKNDLRMIKTRSGHTLTFNDEKDKQSVSLVTSGEQKFEIKDEDGKKSITIADKSGDNSIEIKSDDGACTIKASKKIIIKAGKGTITLDDDGIKLEGGNITIKGTKISSSGSQTEIKASSNLSIDCNGPASVKGAVVKLN